ncbi:hypothetical protein B566_EDAN017206 [Ephemera danica]|nr:hypothetical protein B566_EDAN017206 [Ephemera danica]
MSNWLYLCSLPPTRQPRGNEPTQVLLRLYGQIHGERALEGLITESVIFTLLSERRLGPRLHGVFPGGRLEEYIPARPLRTRELSDPKLSALIGEKIALVHSMNVPISKEPRWLWDTMSRWMQSLQEQNEEQNTSPQSAEQLSKLLKQLTRVGSPVVFGHNDLQEGNILLREDAAHQLVLIDFEYCSYNYRGFDLANHFCEWTYDYTPQQAPNFSSSPELYPSREQQLVLVRSYLATLAREKGLQSVDSAEEEAVLREEYAKIRLEAYFAHKAELLSTCELRLHDNKVPLGQVPGSDVPGQVPGAALVVAESLKRKATEME